MHETRSSGWLTWATPPWVAPFLCSQVETRQIRTKRMGQQSWAILTLSSTTFRNALEQPLLELLRSSLMLMQSSRPNHSLTLTVLS
jgi:hypothetical protein